MLRQIAAVTFLNFKNLPKRFWASLVIVVGMICVVGVLVSMLSLTTGFVQSEMKAGDPGRAIVISQGVENEGGSSLTRDEAAIIVDSPGIRKDVSGWCTSGRRVNTALIGSRLLLRSDGGYHLSADTWSGERGIGTPPGNKADRGPQVPSWGPGSDGGQGNPGPSRRDGTW